MIASLPMYDWPEVREATDAFWQGLSSHIGTSADLFRGGDHMQAWRNPELLFSQTCGYPFTHEFRGNLTYVATPHYAAEGCDGPHYSSVIIAKTVGKPADFRGRIVAVNSMDSMSGMLALKLVFAPLAKDGRFFGRSVVTGGHLASLEAVQLGKADVCAVDAVCVAMAKRYRPNLMKGLVEIANSPLVAGLPFVTRAGDVELLRRGLRQVFDDPALDGIRDSMFLSNYSVISPAHYDRILQLESAVENAGGMQL